MIEASIVEILRGEARGRIPEMAKKPEIFNFFSIFDLLKNIFWIFVVVKILNFWLRVWCRKDFWKRFSSLEDM